MMQPRIVIIGDSLSFPRAHKSQKLENSWPVLLNEMFPGSLVWQRSKGGAMSKDVINECKTFFGYFKSDVPQFDYMIIQIGIVDACPRAIPLFLEIFFDNLKRGGTRMKRIVKRIIDASKIPQTPWVSEKEFRNNIRSILSFTESIATVSVFVEIAPAMHYLLVNAPGIEKNIRKYNDIIKEEIASFNLQANRDEKRVLFLELFKSANCEDLILEDGHHLTLSGHQHVATAVRNCIYQANNFKNE